MAVYQEVTILFTLTRMETVLVRKCFMRYSNFADKLNLQRCMETGYSQYVVLWTHQNKVLEVSRQPTNTLLTAS